MSKAIIFDTETTGLDPRKDEILTLSVIDGDGTARTVAQRSSTLSGGYVESLRGNEVEEHGAWGLRPHPCRTF